MKKKKIQIKIICGKSIMEIDGKKFRPISHKSKMIDGIEHDDYEIWEEVDEKEYQKYIDTIKKKILNKIPKERIIEEALSKYSVGALKRIAKQIEDKKAIAKRQDGCLGIKIDGGKYNSSYISLYE